MTQQEVNKITMFLQSLVAVDNVEIEGKTVSSVPVCEQHGVEMEKKWSEKKQKYYNSHRSEDGQICFGRGYVS